MYKMFRVLMVQSLLEEGTASPAQGLGSQGTEPPTCGNNPSTKAETKPFWIALVMVFITVVAAGILISKRICWMRRQRQTAAQERLEAEKTNGYGMRQLAMEPDRIYWKVEMRGCRNRQHLQRRISGE